MVELLPRRSCYHTYRSHFGRHRLSPVSNTSRLPIFVSLLCASIVGSLVATAHTARALPGDLVISEIMYNPATDDSETSFDDYEYIELFNPTSSTINLTGMSWGSGIKGTFTTGSIPAGGYAVVSPDASATLTQYGVSPIGTFTGKLSNGGETVTLLDIDGTTVVDSVTYDDGNGWPTSPDGNGPSLELLANELDNSLPDSWLPSVSPTPGTTNSVHGTLLGVTNLLATPADPAPATPIVITADIAGSPTATLTYKINVDDGDDDPGTAAAMLDDGVAPDTTAGDGNFAATIPGQPSGALVRYRVDTGAGDGLPDSADSITYLGLVVDDPVNTGLPVLRMWMGPTDWTNLDQNHRFDDVYFPAVFEFDDTVYDAVAIKIRGGDFARANNAKQSYSVEAPSGHDFVMPGYFGYPVDEFSLARDGSWLRAHLGWGVFESAGFPHVETFHVNVQQNNAFFGIYRVQEKLDGTWRSQNALDDGQFFKASNGGFVSDGWSKKTPKDDDYTPIDAFDDLIESPASSSKTQSIYEQVDIPNMVNFAAVTAILKNDDVRWHNFYAYLDDNDTERWQIYPWDLDHSFNLDPRNCAPSDPAVDPSCLFSPFIDAMWELPEFREMYFRRARTLIDTALVAPEIENEIAAVLAQTGDDHLLDAAKWDWDPTAEDSILISDINDRRNHFNNDSRVPSSQTATPGIVINEIHYNGAGNDPEFVELYNTTGDWVDLSGWELDGAGLTIAGGTVVAPNSYIVFTDNDVAFRDLYGTSTSHILAQFPGALSNKGETIELKNAAGTTVDIVTYDDASPWTTAPDGAGPSLELISPSLDNALPGSWTPSLTNAGTPGQPNNGVQAGNVIEVFAKGSIGTEIIELEINGTIVAAYPLTTTLTTYTFTSPTIVQAQNVRITFTNDNGPRNAIIDAIAINGTRWETEAPTTQTKGAWNGSCGIGYKQTETLACNGWAHFNQ